MLAYIPTQRPKPIEILAHPFFDELRDQKTKLPNGNALPELFNFTEGMNHYLIYLEEKQEAKGSIDHLIPEWYNGKSEQQKK
jgi:hypothetical protein